MSPWQELGDGVFRRRYTSYDQNIGAVVGDDGVCLIDSRSNHADADEVRSELAELTSLPVRWLVNTHMHWDHTFGNSRFPDAVIVGHDACRRRLVDEGEAARDRLLAAAWLAEDAKPAFRGVQIVPPSVTFAEAITIHVGATPLHLRFHGRGHTDNDITVTVGDVCFAGDLVEEGAPPSFSDSYPEDWVATLDTVADGLPATVVPGHGDVVDPAFVRAQRDEISAAVAFLRAGAGSPPWSEAVMESIRTRLDER